MKQTVTGDSNSKESANIGDPGSIPESGRYPGEGNGNPLQYSCLENPMHRGAWWVTVHGLQRVRHDLATKQQFENLRSKNNYLILWCYPDLEL